MNSDYANYEQDTCGPSFFSSKISHNYQQCTYCKSGMFINSMRYSEVINGNTCHYREAVCMACKKTFRSNVKEDKYCFWGLLKYKTVDRFDIPM